MADQQRVIRIRRRSAPRVRVDRYAELERLMVLMADAVRQKEAAAQEEEKLTYLIGLELDNLKERKHESAAGTVAYEAQQTRGSRTIDVRAFQERVMEDDFLDSIKVSITAAKKLLTDKEIDEISDHTMPTTSAEKLVFRLPEVAIRKTTRGRRPGR